MNNKVLIAIASVLSGAGGVVIGVLVRQPEINKLQKQVKILQADVSELENVVEEQNSEIAQLLIRYKSLKIYQFSQRRQVKDNIQEQLICQYAAADYLNLLLDCASSGKKMSADEIRYYKMYGKMLEDNQIDDNELEVLRPIILEKHGSEIDRMQECDLRAVFERIRLYGAAEEGSKFKGLLRR